jgi:hypothetical protein
MVLRTASADAASAARSPSESLISTICSSPVRPSFTGTPQNTSRRPNSPVSQAEHGRIRFLSSAIASTICTAAALGA